MANILVVDDEFGIAKLLQEALEDEGHRVDVAANGRQALDKASEKRPNLVITDFMMPVMDGAEFVKTLSTSPDLTGIPVILMSAISEEMIAGRCSGYVAFLRKPFKILHVIDLVETLLAGAK